MERGTLELLIVRKPMVKGIEDNQRALLFFLLLKFFLAFEC